MSPQQKIKEWGGAICAVDGGSEEQPYMSNRSRANSAKDVMDLCDRFLILREARRTSMHLLHAYVRECVCFLSRKLTYNPEHESALAIWLRC